MPVDLSKVPNSFDPRARVQGRSITTRQAAAVCAAAQAKGLDPDAVCLEEFDCPLEELHQRAADMLIRFLNSLDGRELTGYRKRAPATGTSRTVEPQPPRGRKAKAAKQGEPVCGTCPHPLSAAIAGSVRCGLCFCSNHTDERGAV
jgi:hypothetical protein